jgi:hypothetical protein
VDTDDLDNVGVAQLVRCMESRVECVEHTVECYDRIDYFA